MKKSKIFSVVLAMFLILTLNVGAVRAADTARIYLDAVQAKSGIVTVSCKAENVGKISNGKLRITYAADKLHLVKTEAGDGLKKGNFQTVINDPIDGNKAEGEIVFVFASSREQEVSGNLVTMTFSASEKLDLKDTGLNLKAEEWNKTSGSDINVSIKDLQYRSEVIDKIEPTPTPEKKISLNATQIAEIEDQTYTGRAVRPGVTIQYKGKTLTEAKDYALTYKKNKKDRKSKRYDQRYRRIRRKQDDDLLHSTETAKDQKSSFRFQKESIPLLVQKETGRRLPDQDCTRQTVYQESKDRQHQEKHKSEKDSQGKRKGQSKILCKNPFLQDH